MPENIRFRSHLLLVIVECRPSSSNTILDLGRLLLLECDRLARIFCTLFLCLNFNFDVPNLDFFSAVRALVPDNFRFSWMYFESQRVACVCVCGGVVVWWWCVVWCVVGVCGVCVGCEGCVGGVWCVWGSGGGVCGVCGVWLRNDHDNDNDTQRSPSNCRQRPGLYKRDSHRQSPFHFLCVMASLVLLVMYSTQLSNDASLSL